VRTPDISNMPPINSASAIFHIRGIGEFFISNGGFEWDMIMLAVALTIIAAGPGRVSVAHLVKRIPRFLQ